MSESMRNDDTESEGDDEISESDTDQSPNVLNVPSGSSDNTIANRISRFAHIPIVSSLLSSGILENLSRTYYNVMPNIPIESNHINITRFSNTLPAASLLSFLTPEFINQILNIPATNTTSQLEDVSSISNNAPSLSSSSSSSSLGILEMMPTGNNDIVEPAGNLSENLDVTIRSQNLETLEIVEMEDWSRRLNVLRDSSGAFVTARWERIRLNNYNDRNWSESDLDELNRIIPEGIPMSSSMMTDSQNESSQDTMLDRNSDDAMEASDETLVEDATAPSSSFMQWNVVTYDNRSMMVNVSDGTLSSVVSNFFRNDNELEETSRQPHNVITSSPLSSNYVPVENYFADVLSVDSSSLTGDNVNSFRQILEEDSTNMTENEVAISASSYSSNLDDLRGEFEASNDSDPSNSSQQISEGHLMDRVTYDIKMSPYSSSSYLENLRREFREIHYGYPPALMDNNTNSPEEISEGNSTNIDARSSSFSSSTLDNLRREFHAINFDSYASFTEDSINSSQQNLEGLLNRAINEGTSSSSSFSSTLHDFNQGFQANNDSDYGTLTAVTDNSSQQISGGFSINRELNEVTTSSSSSSNLDDLRREFQAINDASIVFTDSLENIASDSTPLSCFTSLGSETSVPSTSASMDQETERNSASEVPYDDEIAFIKELIISCLNEYLARRIAALSQISSSDEDD